MCAGEQMIVSVHQKRFDLTHLDVDEGAEVELVSRPLTDEELVTLVLRQCKQELRTKKSKRDLVSLVRNRTSRETSTMSSDWDLNKTCYQSMFQCEQQWSHHRAGRRSAANNLICLRLKDGERRLITSPVATGSVHCLSIIRDSTVASSCDEA